MASPHPVIAAIAGTTLAAVAEGVMAEHTPENTTRAFASDWARWTEFSDAVTAAGQPLDINRPDAVALVVFAKWLAIGGATLNGGQVRPHAPESIRRRITGVLAGWRRTDHAVPRTIADPARRWVRGYEDHLVATRQSTGRGQATVLVVDGTDSDDLSRIAATTDTATIAGCRDMALVCLGVAIAARSAELSHLDIEDVTLNPGGMYVHIRRAKRGARRVAVPRGARDETCPVRAWQRWIDATGSPTGAAFRQISRHGNVGGRLSPEGCSDVVVRVAERAGINGRFSVHSLRAGFATAAVRADKHPAAIALHAGWAPDSPWMRRYVRQVREWEDPVLNGIGL